jgi:hypothetical protein
MEYLDKCIFANALIEFRTSSTLPPCARVNAHPSITGWKTAPRASGADDAASVLFPDSGGIMLSGVAELSVFSIQMEIRPKRNVATRSLA